MSTEAPLGKRRPLGLCTACGRARWGRAKICRRRTCPGYAPLWAGDQRRKLFDNLSAYDGDQVVILKQGGQIAQVGAPADILAAPADDFVRSFVGLDRGKRTLHVEERDGTSIIVDELGKVTGVLGS